jgi:hypothetical protein
VQFDVILYVKLSCLVMPHMGGQWNGFLTSIATSSTEKFAWFVVYLKFHRNTVDLEKKYKCP